MQELRWIQLGLRAPLSSADWVNMRSLVLFALLSFCLLVPIVFALNEPDATDLGKELNSVKEDEK